MCGARMEPWRARPVPFCLNGLRPAPETSARVLVLWVPWRAAASCATTTWCSSGTLVWTSKISAGRSTWTVLAIGSGSLHCGTDEDDRAAGTGDGALDQQQRLLGVHGMNGQVLRGVALVAHAAGHAQALEDAARGGCATDGTGLAVVLVGTVGGADAGEAVALHDTGEALALGGADDVDLLAGLEELHGQFLAQLVGLGVGGAQLDKVAARGHAGLLEVAGQRLVHLARVDLAVADLDSGVAVAVSIEQLGNDVGVGLDDGHRDNPVVLVPNLGHAELGAQQALHLAGKRSRHMDPRP